jgi:hypothetical protein
MRKATRGCQGPCEGILDGRGAGRQTEPGANIDKLRFGGCLMVEIEADDGHTGLRSSEPLQHPRVTILEHWEQAPIVRSWEATVNGGASPTLKC